MLAPPVTALGLRLSDEVIWVTVGILCEPHLCNCGERVDARGLHGLACRKSAGRQQRHSMINEIIWRALGRASIPSKKEPLGLTSRIRFDGGLGGLNPPISQRQPPSLLEISTPGGRIIQAFNPPIQYSQHILTSSFVHVCYRPT